MLIFNAGGLQLALTLLLTLLFPSASERCFPVGVDFQLLFQLQISNQASLPLGGTEGGFIPSPFWGGLGRDLKFPPHLQFQIGHR